MAPLAPTVRHFPGFCSRKKIPNRCSTFFFPGVPMEGGEGTKKIVRIFFPVAPCLCSWSVPCMYRVWVEPGVWAGLQEQRAQS